MSFKESPSQLQILDLSTVEPDANHARQNIAEDNLQGLVNSIQKVGVIHPIVVRPANVAGRYTVVVGERRRQAALLAGEKTIPAVVRGCLPDEVLEVQVFENIGLGVRSALAPRDMAHAIQSMIKHFSSQDEAAQYFGRAPTWLSQATAAANLSAKVTALLDSGKISSAGSAVQLEKLSKKNEAKADSLIGQIEQLPEGEKVSKKVIDHALAEASGRGKVRDAAIAIETPVMASAVPDAVSESDAYVPPWEEPPAASGIASSNTATRSKVNPSKVKLVAELLGVSDEDEEEVLVRLIDAFLAQKRG